MDVSTSEKFYGIESHVIELICSVCELEFKSQEIELSSPIKDLGIDSIRFMNLLISIEDIIGRDIEDIIEGIEFSEINTVGDVVELVKKFKV